MQVVFSTAFDALLVVDDERRYLHVNCAAVTLLGAPCGEILMRGIGHFTPPEMWPALERLWASLTVRGRVEGRYEVLRGDGARTQTTFRATRNVMPGCHLIAARETPDPPSPPPDPAPMTARERQVLQLAAEGRSSRDIAEALFLSPGTVKTHFQNLYRKLGASDRASAVAQALRSGLIQ